MSLVIVQPFSPEPENQTVMQAVTTSSVAVSFNNVTGASPPRKRSVLVTNFGPNEAYIAFGDATITTSVPVAGGAVGGMPILPNTAQTFEGISATHVAAICAATESATLCYTPGEGI